MILKISSQTCCMIVFEFQSCLKHNLNGPKYQLSVSLVTACQIVPVSKIVVLHQFLHHPKSTFAQN